MTHAQIAARCLSTLQQNRELRRVTAYVSPVETVKVTRRHKPDRRYRHDEFVVAIGVPNYRERLWLKDAKAAHVTFPVRNLLLTYWPKRK